jgi:4-hydroxy-2-oxoheptanedioate aldolase
MASLRTNSLKSKLRPGGCVLGTFLEIPSPQLVELLGLAGFDFVVIDREHGAIGLEKTEELIRAALATEISPMVRVSHCEPVAIRQPLDMGAAGIHVPQIESAEMAQEVVRSSTFFPSGERGLQPFVRAASYRAYPTDDFLRQANEEIVRVLHIEGERGIAQFDDILKVAGIDVAFIGPYDLSQSLGIPGQVRHPLVLDRMKAIIEKAQRAGKAVGTFCDDAPTAVSWRDLGVSYLTVSMDAHIFLTGARQIVSGLKDRSR